MRSIIEQVDEFIEEWHNGSILFSMTYWKNTSGDRMWVSGVDTKSQKQMDDSIDYISENVKSYIAEQDGIEKHHLAVEIFGAVMLLRGLGVIRNNPDSLKELTYWKERASKNEQESTDLRTKVKDAYTMIESLQKTIEHYQKGNPLSK